MALIIKISGHPNESCDLKMVPVKYHEDMPNGIRLRTQLEAYDTQNFQLLEYSIPIWALNAS